MLHKKYTKQKILLLASLCASSFSNISVIADELPAIVISAARTYQSTVTIPSNIKVISRKEIEESGAATITDVLTSVAGVHVSDQFGDGTSAKISMRGFGGTAGSNTLVMVDGRRLNNIDISGPDLSSIAIKDIEQVEIIQSSAGVLYGDQAVGGVINIITRKPEGFSADAAVQTGSYDRTRFTARVANKLAENINYSISSDFIRSDNYRDDNELDSMNILGRMDYEIESGNVFFEFQRTTRFQELPGSLSSADVEVNRRQSNGNGDFLDNATKISRLGVHSTVNNNVFLEAEVASRKTDYISNYSGSAYPIMSEQIEFTPRAIAKFPFNGNKEAVLTAGVDYVSADYISDFQDTERQSTAYYSQLVLPVSDASYVNFGVRNSEVEYKNNAENDKESAYELGARHELSDAITLFARYEENFRFGKIDEINFIVAGDPLNVQVGQSKDLGIEVNLNKATVKVQLYRLDFENEIAFDPSANGPWGTTFGANVNLDPTVHEGIIVEGNYAVDRSLQMGATFTYTNAEFKSGSLKGNNIAGVPEQQLTLTSRYKLTEKFKTYLEAIYSGEYYADGDHENNNAKLDSYTVVNANLSYSWDELEFSIRANNLFDKEYSSNAAESNGSVYFFPSPERNFWLTAAVKF